MSGLQPMNNVRAAAAINNLRNSLIEWRGDYSRQIADALPRLRKLTDEYPFEESSKERIFALETRFSNALENLEHRLDIEADRPSGVYSADDALCIKSNINEIGAVLMIAAHFLQLARDSADVHMDATEAKIARNVEHWKEIVNGPHRTELDRALNYLARGAAISPG